MLSMSSFTDDVKSFSNQKTPRQNIEDSLIGSLIKYPEIFVNAKAIVTANQFTSKTRQEIYQAMEEIHAKGQLPTEDVIKEHLTHDDDRAETLKSMSDFTGVSNTTSDKDMIETWCKSVLNADIKGAKFNKLKSVISTASQDPKLTGEDAIRKVQDEIADAVIAIPAFNTSVAVASVAKENVEAIISKTKKIEVTPTGIPLIDEKIDGFSPGQFIVIGGGTSQGKTALGVNIARELAVPVCYITMELREDLIESLLLKKLSRVSDERIKEHLQGVTPFTDEEESRMRAAAMELEKKNIYIDTSVDIVAIQGVISSMVRDRGVKVVFLDNIQTVKNAPGGSAREKMVYLTRELSTVAKQLGITIVALSQLSRGFKKENRTPRMDDLMESGSLEQDADIVMLIFNSADYETGEPDDDREKTIQIDKNRATGKTGTIMLRFNKSYCEFYEDEGDKGDDLPAVSAYDDLQGGVDKFGE